MILVQSLIVVLSLLACTLASASSPVRPALLSGLLENLVFFWLLFALIGRVNHRWARAFFLALLALALSSVQAHVLINGSWPQLAHADLAADGDFLVALFSDRVFLILLSLNLAWMLFTGLSARLRRLPSPRPALTATIGTVLVAYLALTAVFTPGIGAYWYSRGPLGHQFVGPPRVVSEGVSLVDGRLLVPAIDGERLQPIAPPRHVLLVLVEGLSAHHVKSGQVPALAALVPKGWRVPRFVAHQRQTHRGLFSALCGAYPNLVRREAKSDLMAMAGLRPPCLPAVLGSAGIRTAFLQSADLGFMAKDLFADAAGFQVVKGL